MHYPESVRKILASTNAEIGDSVEVESEGRKIQGVVMPHHEFSAEDVLTLKLDSGYNVGIKADAIINIRLIAKAEGGKKVRSVAHAKAGKPPISLLSTGGTIASYVDYRTGAVHPALTAEDLIYAVPELAELCDVRARVLYSLYSENIRPEHWKTLAEESAAELNGGAAAVIIPHGTDTMAFSAAALSFMLRDLTGPVIFVGSQRSSDRPSSDAFQNLLSAAHLASSDLGEVVLLMHGETSDSYATVLRGTKVRKMHSSRRDAFKPLNIGQLGRVAEDGGVDFLFPQKGRSKGPVSVDAELDEKVALLNFYPGMPASIFERTAEENDGMVLAGTGLGHVSSEWLPAIRKAVDGGKAVVMTTQCLQGRVNLNVYETGRDLQKAGVISGEDMLPETALVKLMWVLGHTRDLAEVSRLMTTNLIGEINESITIDQYPW